MFYVYIMANKKCTTIYVGMTNNLERRVFEHKNHLIDGYTKRYNVVNLVYYESVNDSESAIFREKQIKGWKREKKNDLINSMNEKWLDLSADWFKE